MTREQAIAALQAETLSYDELDEVFEAFGFTYDVPSYATRVYYHPAYEAAGIFPARRWLPSLSQAQMLIVRTMVGWVRLREAFSS